jgi:hypothetical protein
VGAGVLVGRSVGFSPTPAEAAEWDCRTVTFIEYSCWGPYSEAISECRMASVGSQEYCECICYAGPGKCTPQYFRAHANWSDALCCCST